MSINVQQAVITAQQYFNSIQNMILSGTDKIEDLRLEEVELSDDKKFWLITLGYNVPVKSPLTDILPDSKRYERDYKIFKIDSETGEVQSMKIREL